MTSAPAVFLCAVVMTLVAACESRSTTTTPSSTPGGVRIVFQGDTARRSDLPASVEACVNGVGATHIHPSWRSFAVSR